MIPLLIGWLLSIAGAQEPDRKPNTVSYYELLGVSPQASLDDIKKGYRAMALKYHPDKIENPEKRDEAADIFMRISEAHDLLSGDQRSRYDALLARGYLEYDQETYERVIEGRTRPETFEEMEAREKRTLLIGAVMLVVCLLPVAYGLWKQHAKKTKAEKAFKSKLVKSRNEAMQQEQIRQQKQQTKPAAVVQEEDPQAEDGGEEEGDEELDEKATAEMIANRKLRSYHKKVRAVLRNLLQAQAAEAEQPRERRKGKKGRAVVQSDDETESPPQREWHAEEFNQACEGVEMTEIIAMAEALCKAYGIVAPVAPVEEPTEESSLGSFEKLEKPGVEETEDNGGPTGDNDADTSSAADEENETARLQRDREARHKKLSAEWTKKFLAKGERSATQVLQDVKDRLEYHIQAASEEEKAKEEQREARLAQQRLEARKAAERAKKLEKKAMSDWTPTELTILTRAVAKYPGGTARRWEIITRTVNTGGRNDRSEKAVIAKARELENSGGAAPTAAASSSSSSSTTSADASSASTASIALVSEEPTSVDDSENLASESKEKPSPSPSSAAATAAAPVDGWTADQQAAFETALRTVDKNAADRWDQVTAQVEGKSKREVIQRYKDIQLLIKKRSSRKA